MYRQPGGQAYIWRYGWMDTKEWTDRWKNGLTDGQTDIFPDKHVYHKRDG